MMDFLKRLFNPKELFKKAIASAIESLDLLVPLLAKELEEAKERINSLNSHEKAQYVIDKVQDFLRKKFLA